MKNSHITSIFCETMAYKKYLLQKAWTWAVGRLNLNEIGFEACALSPHIVNKVSSQALLKKLLKEKPVFSELRKQEILNELNLF